MSHFRFSGHPARAGAMEEGIIQSSLKRSQRNFVVLHDVLSPISGRVVVFEHRLGCSSLKRSLRFFAPSLLDESQDQASWDESDLVQSEVQLQLCRKAVIVSCLNGFSGVNFASASRLELIIL